MSRLVALLLVLPLSGCATIRNTPQQDATHALFTQCRAETNSSIWLEEVLPDGGFRWRGHDADGGIGMRDCMAKKWAEKGEWVVTPSAAWGVASTLSRFEACKVKTGYTGAVVTEVNPDGSFRYRGDDREAEKDFKPCLRGKGLRIY